MKGIKITLLVASLIGLTYLGVAFVELNREDVVVHFGVDRQSSPMALGFIILNSLLIGMIIAGVVTSVELLTLSVQNRRLKRKLAAELKNSSSKLSKLEPQPPSTDVISPRTSGRFT